MTFNWFNRDLGPQPEPPEQNNANPSPDAAAAESESSSEELLNFAKAAYEALKQKQQALATPSPEAPTAAAPPSAPATAAPVIAPDTPAPESPSDTGSVEVSPEASATESDAQPGDLPDTTEAKPARFEPPKLVAPPRDDSALPFWARAEADRELRLARLRETVIEPPQPAAPPPSTPMAPPAAAPASEPMAAPEESLILDGDFLWSAEVLAQEGRRPEDISLEEITWLKRLRQGLDRTRRSLVNNLRAIVGQGPLNDEAVLEIEALLLQADVGVEATDRIVDALQHKLRQDVLPPEQAIAFLKQLLRELLEEPLQGHPQVAFVPEKGPLNIWLITGVNGAGKTTTIGKLAHIATKSGYTCLIAAADTFRAAAVEQVKAWGQRSQVDVIANPGKNTDPAAVVFDAITAARSRGTDLLLVDTAGRLQNKKNLMEELSKINRIIHKQASGAKIESLLVLDATLGQNGLQQAKVFAEAAQLSGVVLTKLDGTAKGGIALAIVQQLGLPIRFIGAGEGLEDLRPFSSYEFVEALISG